MHKEKIILMVTLICIMLAPDHAAAQKNFTDLPPDHWAYHEIIALTEKGVIGGYDDGSVRPNNPVTREELAKIAFTLFPAAMEKSFPDKIESPDYPDIHNRWSSASLNTAICLVPGYTDGQFKPSEPATRRDVAILLLYARLIQDGEYQLENGELNIILPLPEPDVWEKIQQFKEYSGLEKLYRQSARYFESDPDKKQFSKYAGQFFSHLNNIALLVEKKIVRGYSDSSLRLENTVTRAETCAIARRICDMDLTGVDKYILESPPVKGTPHTIKCDSHSAHAKMGELGQWYRKKYPDPEERARKIYDFMVFNFTYNWDYRAGISRSAPTSLESTLATGTGTDVNFANMYAVLAQYAGIKAAVLKGKAGNPTDSGPHTWVELTIDGKNIQVDPTYDICTGKDYFGNFESWQEKGYKWTEESRYTI